MVFPASDAFIDAERRHTVACRLSLYNFPGLAVEEALDAHLRSLLERNIHHLYLGQTAV